MTNLVVILLAIVAIVAGVKFIGNSNNKFLGSSTSMLFGNQNMNAGAAC